MIILVNETGSFYLFNSRGKWRAQWTIDFEFSVNKWILHTFTKIYLGCGFRYEYVMLLHSYGLEFLNKVIKCPVSAFRFDHVLALYKRDDTCSIHDPTLRVTHHNFIVLYCIVLFYCIILLLFYCNCQNETDGYKRKDHHLL